MSDTDEEALRRQTFLRALGLTFAGYGICPGCMQKKAVFARRRTIPDMGKERCLDCWKMQR